MESLEEGGKDFQVYYKTRWRSQSVVSGIARLRGLGAHFEETDRNKNKIQARRHWLIREA